MQKDAVCVVQMQGCRRSFAGRVLRERLFVDCDLSLVDFSHSDLQGSDFRGARLNGADFRNADIRNTRFDMNSVVEIRLPATLPLDIVNQIRTFDFLLAARRNPPAWKMGHDMVCPYRGAVLKPLFHTWGSATWNGGSGWVPGLEPWTAEEIIACVLSALGCRHGFPLPEAKLRGAYV